MQGSLAPIGIFALISMPIAKPVIVHSGFDLEERERGHHSNERA
jgi:hypothetical protein